MGDLRAALERRAREEGFAAVGVTTPGAMAAETAPALAGFIAKGRHGDMGWMAERMGWRGDPTALWPEARSVVMLAENYAPDDDPLDALARPDRAAISVYARGRDYHDLVKKRLKRLGRWLVESHGGEIKVFVDTAPVMEKPLAEAAGVGWRGKHTNLVSRDLGSWFFLGAVFTTLEIEPDAPETDHCGACRRCLDICPTAAFPAVGELDARRCISYLTIEHHGPIPAEFRAPMGNRIYGCDDCLAICPWNKFAEASAQQKLWARAELKLPDLQELAALDDTAFREVFSGSPVKRTGRNRMLRNVLIAIGNSGAPDLVEQSVIPHLSDEDPVVRGAAVWALSRLDMARFERERDSRAEAESDDGVKAEWALKPV